MGALHAQEIADLGVDLETAIGWHLRHNHFPPVPASMVPVCIAAIDAYAEDEPDRSIELPTSVAYRGSAFAPAWAIADAHHLGPWLEEAGGW